MEVYVGGRAQGKLDYVRGRYPEKGRIVLGRVPGWRIVWGRKLLSIFICL